MTHHKHHTNSFIRDLGKITKPVSHIIETGIHSVEHVASAPFNAIEKSAGSLSMPLVIGGIAVLAFVIMQNRR
jgi:hypothetical protein